MTDQPTLGIGMTFTRITPRDGVHRSFLRDTTIGFPYTIFSLEDGRVYIKDDASDTVCMTEPGFHDAFAPREFFRPMTQVEFEQDTVQTLQFLVKRISELTQTIQELKDYIQGTKNEII